MITLTKEWLLKTIAELEEERDATPGAVNEDAAMALAAMKLALASLEAEPVAWIVHARTGDQLTADGGYVANAEGILGLHSTPLYTAPPALASVPDERAAFNAWNNDTDCPLAGRNAKTAAWLAWSRRAAMLQGADGKPELTVWYGAMPETNGKTNWTAMLHRKGHHPWEGITIDRSEYPGRVRYEADRMRHLIGELADEPDILAYDSDAHSGYVEPVTTAYKLRDAVEIIRSSGIEIDAEKIFAERDALNAPDCWCRTCRPITLTDMRFVVCPVCGNKRCPHANDHRNACTGSNEPGQEGSAYPAAPQQEVK